MLKLRPLDPACPIDQQLQSKADPVVLVNLFSLADTGIPALMSAWEKDTLWTKQQPGSVALPHRFAKVAATNLFAA